MLHMLKIPWQLDVEKNAIGNAGKIKKSTYKSICSMCDSGVHTFDPHQLVAVHALC